MPGLWRGGQEFTGNRLFVSGVSRSFGCWAGSGDLRAARESSCWTSDFLFHGAKIRPLFKFPSQRHGESLEEFFSPSAVAGVLTSACFEIRCCLRQFPRPGTSRTFRSAKEMLVL